MTSNYLATALMMFVGVGFALALTALAKYVGPRRFNKAKDVPYECGSDVIGSPRARFEVKFYQVAILFLVFDIEAAFLYPWAVNYKALSCAGPMDGEEVEMVIEAVLKASRQMQRRHTADRATVRS